MNAVSTIFCRVADALHCWAAAWHITYNEINIIVYYLFIPLTWTIMLDCYLRRPITTCILLPVWAVIAVTTRGHFAAWCDRAFMLSVDFLNYFNRWGGNYVLNSVIICVVVPILIYAGLALLLFMNK